MLQTKNVNNRKTIIEQNTILSSRFSCIIVLRNFSFSQTQILVVRTLLGKQTLVKTNVSEKFDFTTFSKHFYIMYLDILLSLFVGETRRRKIDKIQIHCLWQTLKVPSCVVAVACLARKSDLLYQFIELANRI